MDSRKDIPDGYEVKTDMFGEPYLQRKTTPAQRRLSRIIFVPGLVAVALIIRWLLCH